MTASCNIVVNYVSWKFNDGTKVNFWRDSWNGQIPLSNDLISLNIIEVSELHWGTEHYRFTRFDELGGNKSNLQSFIDTSFQFYNMQDFHRKLKLEPFHPITKKL